MDIKTLSNELQKLKETAEDFFSLASTSCDNDNSPPWMAATRGTNNYWEMLDDNVQHTSRILQKNLLPIISSLIPAVKASPLLNESDEKELGLCLKRMRAALRLRDFISWNTEVLHDEGVVLGVNPPGQSVDNPSTPKESRESFFQCHDQLAEMVEFLSVSPSTIPDGLPSRNPNLPNSYRPNTAFIMMRINPNNPDLDDVYDTYKKCFEKFRIKAIRADEIEHEDVITSRIIDEIKTSEFLVGDLTDERPSVYYEIGYAHSLGRRVIMYRKHGTSIHFDLAAYNCPEYKNMRELNDLLLKRLEQATNRKPEKG